MMKVAQGAFQKQGEPFWTRSLRQGHPREALELDADG